MSTIIKGNNFRDLVASTLEAAGFHAESEIRIGPKKVDVTWHREDIDGIIRYGVEAKDYSSTLSMVECREFVTDYGTLVSDKAVDRAWLISRGDVSPDGRLLVDKNSNLKCMTFAELQRRLMNLDPYLRHLVETFEHDRIPEWFVAPHTDEDEPLDDVVDRWLVEDDAPPLAIVSGYGKGKTTFARHLATRLARKALADSTERLPILIPLGEIVEEQSLEGLLGKVFTTGPGIRGYNFGLFQNLNRLGRFVIIFDGFDEMKHGMTLHRFEQMIVELMRLDTGGAKIVILGRDTAFQDDIEFKSIILGRQTTSGGTEVAARDRRAFRQVQLREFSLNEAHAYVRAFFPIAAHDALRQLPETEREHWKTTRIGELTAGTLDPLLIRPVHAQMLCHIATDRAVELKSLSKHGLFDRFVHFLLDREVRKAGRNPNFTLAARRRFNAEVALWLWLQGGVSTTSLAHVPFELCKTAADGVQHDYDESALRKELTAGCLIEKAAGTVYFGHRSLQEFLVSEAILTRSASAGFSEGDLGIYIRTVNAEIVDFIVGALDSQGGARKAMERWLAVLPGWECIDLEKTGMRLLVALYERLKPDNDDLGPWQPFLEYFSANGQIEYTFRSRRAREVARRLAFDSRTESFEVQASTALLIARLLSANQEHRSDLVAGMIDPSSIRTAIAKARELGKHKIHYVQREADYALWLLLSSMTFSMSQTGSGVVIDLDGFYSGAAGGSPVDVIDRTTEGGENFVISPQALYRSWGARESEIERVRPFFAEKSISDRIKPLEVEVLRKRHVRPPAVSEPLRLRRPVLTMPGKKLP